MRASESDTWLAKMRSHVSLTLTNWAKQRNVIIFVLSPHSSYLTQQSDVGVFGPLKNDYNIEFFVITQRNPGCSITKYDIAALTKKAYLKALCSENLVSAFKECDFHLTQFFL